MSCALALRLLCNTDYTADSGPYGLTNFLPIGALVLLVNAPNIACTDHWHAYSTRGSGLFSTEDDQIMRVLDFLILHKFLAASCRIVAGSPSSSRPTQLYIRIYLIPYDLANVEGILRRRDEALVLSPARRYMRALLSRVTCDTASWEGKPPQMHLPFYQPDEVSNSPCSMHSMRGLMHLCLQDDRTLAEIYNSLPSPVVRETQGDMYDTFKQLANDVLNKPIPGMTSTLHQYQRRSIVAMVQREMHSDIILNPLYVPIHGLDGRIFYLQPATMEILQSCPTVSQNRGGILCEELGTL